MNRLLPITAPRVQAPLAAVTLLVLIAMVLLQALRVTEFCGETARVGAMLVGGSSLPVVRLLLLRRAPSQAYAGAVRWPPALAAFIGPVLVAHMRARVPQASFSFAGVSLTSLGPVWPVLVAILSALFGLLGSVALSALVWLVSSAITADEDRGARRFTVTAWSIALACAVPARFALGPNERIYADAAALLAMIGLLLQGAAMACERRGASAPYCGPYRGS